GGRPPARRREGPPPPAEFCGAVNALLERDPTAVFTSDGGEFGQWAQACLDAPYRLTNGPAGAIGAAVPFAVAARLALPPAPIVAMSGDGAFGFHMAEFDTAVRYGLPFVVVVGNDAAWNAERQIRSVPTAPGAPGTASSLPRATTGWSPVSAVTGSTSSVRRTCPRRWSALSGPGGRRASMSRSIACRRRTWRALDGS